MCNGDSIVVILYIVRRVMVHMIVSCNSAHGGDRSDMHMVRLVMVHMMVRVVMHHMMVSCNGAPDGESSNGAHDGESEWGT